MLLQSGICWEPGSTRRASVYFHDGCYNESPTRMWCYIYTAAGAVPSGKRETYSCITPGVLSKGADANSLALLHAGATVSRRWFKAYDKSLAWTSTPIL